MLALSFDNTRSEGDLVYEDGALLAEGDDLETAVLMSLLCDAPALPGDLPDGSPRRGFWADVYDEDGDVLGSRLWLLEREPVTEATAQRAQLYAKDALKWLIDGGHIRSVSATTELGDLHIELSLTLTLRNGNTVQLGPFKVR